MSDKINAELLERIKKLPAIDTHEHMTYEKDFLRGEYDFTSLMNYIGLDIGMAGFTRNLWGAGQSEVKSGGSVASVLAQRVADGLCDIDEAEVCARRLFHDNPWNTFAFENWKESDPD